jgi:hypothetical protein
LGAIQTRKAAIPIRRLLIIGVGTAISLQAQQSPPSHIIGLLLPARGSRLDVILNN